MYGNSGGGDGGCGGDGGLYDILYIYVYEVWMYTRYFFFLYVGLSWVYAILVVGDTFQFHCFIICVVCSI